MRGNTFGKMLSMTSFGESHGPAMGVVVDGIPAGIPLSPTDLQKELDRRSPGKSAGTSSRKEEDGAEILSGVFEGKTLGTPLCIVIKNKDQRSRDYDPLKETFRPGHADLTTLLKYGHRDHRGGGRSSGRETISRVIGGYLASLILPKLNVWASIIKMGPFKTKPPLKRPSLGPYQFADPSQEENIEAFLLDLKEKGDSVGGIVSIKAENVPMGLGEPCFDKLKADLGKALLSVGAVAGFSYGLGESFSDLTGKELSERPPHFGGMEGGISNGETLELQVVFKPPATVGEAAQKGRHDPCIMPRACVVLESMVKFVIADHYLRQKAYEF
ncbi:MAG: chorismate synthase [Bacteriovoracales bacterium]|nr:chorismate synthase [Bacteriovoracales bacterium]